MKGKAMRMVVLALALFPAGAAYAQSGDVATVISLYVEQAPGLLTQEGLARGNGPRWAEIRRTGEGIKTGTELVHVPAGVTLRTGDRVLVAARGEPSASAGAGSPSRVSIEPQLERPMDLTAQGLRAPVTRPLAVVPGTCVPF